MDSSELHPQAVRLNNKLQTLALLQNNHIFKRSTWLTAFHYKRLRVPISRVLPINSICAINFWRASIRVRPLSVLEFHHFTRFVNLLEFLVILGILEFLGMLGFLGFLRFLARGNKLISWFLWFLVISNDFLWFLCKKSVCSPLK
jgi:hypothetical protein